MFNRYSIGIILILLILGSGYLLMDRIYPAGEKDAPQPNNEEVSEVPRSVSAFHWRFQEADSLNPDGGNQTDIYLAATYSDNEVIEKLVDRVDGGCSELQGEKQEGDVSNTGKVQCYYAGLGQSYRITRDGDSYLVERKYTEEALPDVPFSDEEWVVIEEFSSR